jgi:hypothetical protein
VERTIRQKEEELDVQAMGMVLIGEGCRHGMMSSYLGREAGELQRCVERWV